MNELIGGLTGVMAGGLSTASLTPVWHFSGAFHPVVVHFPIALLTVAGMVEGFNLLPWRKKARQEAVPSATAFTCLWLGAIGAVVAAVFGWANADATTEFNRSMADVLLVHRWLGVAVAGLGLIMACVATVLRRGYTGRRLPWGYRAGVLATAGLVGLAGSYGGKLTHGVDYYNDAYNTMVAALDAAKQAAPAAVAEAGDVTEPPAALEGPAGRNEPTGSAGTVTQAPVTPAAPTGGAGITAPKPPETQPALAAATPAPWGGGRIRYEHDIKPILDANCVKCHNEGKRKGGYRLDAPELILHAGDSGDAPVVPGRADDSLLVKVIEGKGEFADLKMPPKGNVLTPDKIDLIRRWINEGATLTP